MDEIASSDVTGIWRNQNNMTDNMNRTNRSKLHKFKEAKFKIILVQCMVINIIST